MDGTVNAASELLARIRALGGELMVEGKNLRYRFPQPVPADLIEQMRAHKPALLRLLAGEPARPVPEWEATLRAWLASLGEADPDPVIQRCRQDPEARADFLAQARSWARQEKVNRMLARNPALRLAVVVEDEGDRYVAAVGIRGQGVAEYGIDRDRYDGLKLLELVERHGGKWPEMEAAA